VSTFDFVELLLVGEAVFLLTRDFFSIAICAFSRIDLTALRNTLVQTDGQTRFHTKDIVKPRKRYRGGDQGDAAKP
jgi:hypothetical protein